MSLAVLCGTVNAGCANVYPPPRPAPAELAAAAPPPLWSRRAGPGLTAPVARDDSTLFIAGYDRKVRAIDLRTGLSRWESRLPGVVTGGVAYHQGIVYAGSGRPEGRVYAFETHKGKRVWRRKVDNVSAPLAVVDGILVAQSRSGLVFGLDPKTGEPRWRQRLGVGRVAPAPDTDGTMVIATLDSVFRLRATDGSVLIRRRSPGAIVSAWQPSGDQLLAGTTDSLVVALRADSLTERWRARLDAPVLAAPAVVGDTLFAVTRIGTLYRIAKADGATARIVALHWPATTAPTPLNDLLLIGGADGSVRAFRHDGTEAWRLALWRPVPIAPVVLTEGLVTFGGNGDLHFYQP